MEPLAPTLNHKYKAGIKSMESDKRTSLRRYEINYDLKKFFLYMLKSYFVHAQGSRPVFLYNEKVCFQSVLYIDKNMPKLGLSSLSCA